MSQPLVSVIVTTKNNEATLGECLASIRRQNYQLIELIVVDNNSTDATVKIATSHADKVYTKGPERSAQRNFGVSKCKGLYVLIIDSDMELSAGVVTECIKAVDTKHQAVIIPEESFGEGFWAQCKALERSFYVGVEWIEAPRFFDKKLYQKVGGYDDDMAGGEDWDLNVRVRKLTKVTQVKSSIRHNEGCPTLKNIITKRRYYAKGFKSYYSKEQVKKDSRSPIKQVLSYYILYFSHPLQLFHNPIIGISMLFMKTLEFGALAI